MLHLFLLERIDKNLKLNTLCNTLILMASEMYMQSKKKKKKKFIKLEEQHYIQCINMLMSSYDLIHTVNPMCNTYITTLLHFKISNC